MGTIIKQVGDAQIAVAEEEEEVIETGTGITVSVVIVTRGDNWL